ncbi:MAG: hypothetical protein ABI579_02070 [Candidatus Sumerlaeota bacterium]
MSRHRGFDQYLHSQLSDAAHPQIWLELAIEEYEEDHDLQQMLHCFEKVDEARGSAKKLPARGEELCALVSKAPVPIKEIDKLLHVLGFHGGVRKWEPTGQEATQATGT